MVDSMLLIDMIPLFMQLSAVARDFLGEESELSERWMHLACRLMVTAALEHLVVVGDQDHELPPSDDTIRSAASDGILLALGWGYHGTQEDAMRDLPESEDDLATSRMFAVQVEADTPGSLVEIPDWRRMVNQYTNRLIPAGGALNQRPMERAKLLQEHFLNISQEFPVDHIEQQLLQFLASLSEALPEPILTQVEHGQIDGMTESETEVLLHKCGIRV